MAAASRAIPLASYLFKRLQQLGVNHIYGVPGDYTLRALDHVKSTGIRFVGCCNELNAGYAADGYARALRWRRRGRLGALITTFGVGELSAANAVACSYAEHVPLVHIVGTPNTKTWNGSAANGSLQTRHRLVHHALPGKKRDHQAFSSIAEEITEKVLDLRGLTESEAPVAVDECLSTALRTHLPVYIQLPTDMVAMDVAPQALEVPLPLQDKHHSMCNATAPDQLQDILRRIYAAERPMLLVDRAQGMDDYRHEINQLVERTGLPTLVMPSGLSMIETNQPDYYGVHSGPIGPIDTTPFVQESDLVVAFGPMFSDTQTIGWRTVPDSGKLMILDGCILTSLLEGIDAAKLRRQDTTSLGDFRTLPIKETKPTDGIDQEAFYQRLSPHLRENDTVLLGNATPVVGGRDLVLPPSSQLILSGVAYSIGHMLPAALGVAQVQKGKPGRTVLLDGDGSFQVTAQELSTIIYERLNVIIFIVNNDGYTYERLIHGADEEYNDIAPWNYLAAPSLFGGDAAARDGYHISTHRVETWGELDSVLSSEGFIRGRGLTLVDVRMGRLDVPPKAKAVWERAGKSL